MQLSEEETRFLSRWAKTRKRGQWRYIVTRGLLWGILVGIASHLFKAWDMLKSWDTAALTDSFISTDFMVRFFIYSAIGLGIHAYHWNTNTKRYYQLKTAERRAKSAATATKD